MSCAQRALGIDMRRNAMDSDDSLLATLPDVPSLTSVFLAENEVLKSTKR